MIKISAEELKLMQRRREAAMKGSAWSDLFGGELIVKQPKKVEKAAKATDGMFKSMISAGPKAAAMQVLMTVFKEFMIVLKPFEIILKLVGTLFKVMGAEIMKDLMVVLKPVMNMLIALIPLFKSIGGELGNYIVKLLGSFFNALALLSNVITILVKGDGGINIFIGVMRFLLQIMTKVGEVIGWVVGLLMGRSPGLIPAFLLIWDVLKNIVGFIYDVFKGAFDWIIVIFKGFVNALIFIVNSLIGFLNLIPGVDITPISYLQYGGIITSPTLAMMGETESEAVIPLSKLDDYIKPLSGTDPELIYELQQNTKINMLILRYIKEGY